MNRKILNEFNTGLTENDILNGVWTREFVRDYYGRYNDNYYHLYEFETNILILEEIENRYDWFLENNERMIFS